MKKSEKENKKKKEQEAERLTLRASEFEDKDNLSMALRLYRRAAKLGHTPAQNNLANLLDDKVIPRRSTEAIYWYKRAVKSGDWVAARNLAVHYRNLGNGRWHVYWLGVAADMGDRESKSAYRRLLNIRRSKKVNA